MTLNEFILQRTKNNKECDVFCRFVKGVKILNCFYEPILKIPIDSLKILYGLLEEYDESEYKKFKLSLYDVKIENGYIDKAVIQQYIHIFMYGERDYNQKSLTYNKNNYDELVKAHMSEFIDNENDIKRCNSFDICPSFDFLFRKFKALTKGLFEVLDDPLFDGVYIAGGFVLKLLHELKGKIDENENPECIMRKFLYMCSFDNLFTNMNKRNFSDYVNYEYNYNPKDICDIDIWITGDHDDEKHIEIVNTLQKKLYYKLLVIHEGEYIDVIVATKDA